MSDDAAQSFSRRAFLVGTTTTAALAYAAFPGHVLANRSRPIRALKDAVLTNIQGPVPDLVLSVERDADLLLLDFAFYDFELVPGDPVTLVPTSTDNVIVVQFPPQAVGEAIYPWNQGGTVLNVDPAPILADLSAPARLCFSVPTGLPPITLNTMTAEDLVHLFGEWQMLVPGGALAMDQPYGAPSAPTEFQTAIEFPYGMILAPVAGDAPILYSFFNSPPGPLVSPAGVTDLWSSQLQGFPAQVSMVWADDFIPYPDTTGPADDTPETNINYTYLGTQ